MFLQEVRPKPTAQLDRTNDTVYHSTTCVVRSVMALSQSVQQQQVALYLENVKSVGFELRKLLEAVDQLVPALPVNTHREVSFQGCRKGYGESLYLLFCQYSLHEYRTTSVRAPSSISTPSRIVRTPTQWADRRTLQKCYFYKLT